MAKRATILKVTGLRRAFGPNTIFEKFNLEVRTGEAIALTGRNGPASPLPAALPSRR